MTITIEKTFYAKNVDHTFGKVRVEMDGIIKIDGEAIPEISVEYLLGYILQPLQNTYAGVGSSKTVEDAAKGFKKLLGKIKSGTVNTRSAGSGVSRLHEILRSKTYIWAKAGAAETFKKWKAEKDLKVRHGMIDAWLDDDANADMVAKLSKIAEMTLAREIEEAEMLAELAGDAPGMGDDDDNDDESNDE